MAIIRIWPSLRADGIHEPGEITDVAFENRARGAELAGAAGTPTPTFATDETTNELVAELCKRISSREGAPHNRVVRRRLRAHVRKRSARRPE